MVGMPYTYGHHYWPDAHAYFHIYFWYFIVWKGWEFLPLTCLKRDWILNKLKHELDKGKIKHNYINNAKVLLPTWKDFGSRYLMSFVQTDEEKPQENL